MRLKNCVDDNGQFQLIWFIMTPNKAAYDDCDLSLITNESPQTPCSNDLIHVPPRQVQYPEGHPWDQLDGLDVR